MTGTEYQKLAMRTATKLHPMEALRHGMFMLASEAGECCSIMQKIYQGHNLDTNKIVDELSDVLWAAARVCDAMGFTLDEVMEHNIEKLKKRYPNGFEVERSLNRGEA